MEIQSGIEIVYVDRNRREDVKRAEEFFKDLPLKIVFPQSVSETKKQATLAMRVASGDIIIRPVKGIVEYQGLEQLDYKKYIVSFDHVGQRDESFSSGSGPAVTICDRKQGGLHLNLYGLPKRDC